MKYGINRVKRMKKKTKKSKVFRRLKGRHIVVSTLIEVGKYDKRKSWRKQIRRARHYLSKEIQKMVHEQAAKAINDPILFHAYPGLRYRQFAGE